MKTIHLKLLLLSGIFLFSSCSKLLLKEDKETTATQNFESLWKTADIHYSYFTDKNIDWDAQKRFYEQSVYDGMPDEELFDVLASMLNVLRDGHVNLIAPFNVSRYPVGADAQENFNYRLLKDNYIGWDYEITGSLAHTKLYRDGYHIAYLRYSSFANMLSEADLNYVFGKMQDTRGMIIDLRSNGGGVVTNVYTLGSHLADRERKVFTMYDKTGPGHNDFGRSKEVKISPSDTLNYTQKVMILTNRTCFSATSFFCTAMKAFPHVLLVGDTTGGGMGAPGYFELPNGWTYRMSVTKTIAVDGSNYEPGVPPDIPVVMNPEHEANGVDDIMEAALNEIVNQ